MSTPNASSFLKFPIENRILALIPKDEYVHIQPDLTPVRLPQGKTLWNAGDSIRYAYFPLSGMISLISTTDKGSSVEVGMIGSEGLAGISTILKFDNSPYQATVQIQTAALRIKVSALQREFRRGGRLQDLLLRYTHALLTQISQSASCNRFHTSEERLCRWLLIGRDRAETDTLELTQEFLAQMIGGPRTSVTAIAGKIQRMGFIRYSRGKIRILDRRGLENFSCECYKVISEEISRYLAA
jgi:CRP-like cAMP-binding protein